MYKIVFEKTAQKKLYSLPSAARIKIIQKIKSLEKDPRPHGSKKLTARPGYRIRFGDYRIIYLIEDNILTVLIIDIDHRSAVYK